MLEITCRGTPQEIGYQHGSEARESIKRCIAFYADTFRKAASLEWDAVTEHAKKFEPNIKQKWPNYFEEMRGIAEGSGTDVHDIVALNVRTEIMFGCHTSLSDGCTSFSWHADNGSFLGQNWDWMESQRENIVLLTIKQMGKPTIKVVTEAGIIGKIGLNSAGVGICLNAIRVSGVDVNRIPCHLGLRRALECNTRDEAEYQLCESGVASACHMLLADETGGVGLEWSAIDVQTLDMDERGQVFHSNHYIKEHPGLDVKPWLADSDFRLSRVEQLCNDVSGEPTLQKLQKVLDDEKNHPAAICRAVGDGSDLATLFSILMDLKAKQAVVRLGRPVAPEEVIRLSF